MRKIIVNSNEVLIDEEDYIKVSPHPWVIGYNGYVEYKYDDKGKTVVVRIHQLIMSSNPLQQDVDHIDGDILNNQKSNLRLATRQENSFNKSKTTDATSSKYKGVYFGMHIGKWIGNINFNYTTIYLMSSRDEDECAYAYNIAALLLIKDFAYLNKIKRSLEPETRAKIEEKVTKKLKSKGLLKNAN